MKKSVHTGEYRALIRWLARARRKRGLTMDTAGAKVKKPSSWVAKTEMGERRLDVVEYIRYCRALNVSPVRGIRIIERELDK